MMLACQTALTCMLCHSANDTAGKTDNAGLKEQAHRMHAWCMSGAEVVQAAVVQNEAVVQHPTVNTLSSYA